MYSRICIMGRPGSGKSTFAQDLHTTTGLPLYHLDHYFFSAGWVEAPYEQFLSQQRKFVSQDAWIIDGNSLQSLELRYARAQVCLYFNYPRLLCTLRLFKRRFFKDKAINDRAVGCPERISWKLLHYLWTFESRKNYFLMKLVADLRTRYPDVLFVEIKNERELTMVSTLLKKDNP